MQTEALCKQKHTHARTHKHKHKLNLSKVNGPVFYFWEFIEPE